MKTILIISFLAVVFAEFESHDTKYEHHYSQHRSSVNAAKAGVAQRLAKLEDGVASTGGLNQVQYSSGHTAGGTQRYVAGCSYCTDTGYASASRTGSGSSYDSRSSTRSGSNDLTNSDYVGVGFVGHSSDMRNSRLSSSRSDDVQSVAVPTYSSSSSNKYTEAEDMQQRQVPVVYPTERQSSRYSSASNQESYRAEQAVPVYRPVPVASTRYSSSASNQESSVSKTESTPVYIPGSSRTYIQHADHNADQQGTNTYYIPSTGRYTVYARPGSTTYLRVPVRIPAGDVQTGVQSDHSESDSSSSNTRTSVTGGQNSIVYRPIIYNETASNYRSENRAERVIPGANRQVIYYPVVQSQTASNQQASEDNRSEVRNYETYRPAAITERSQSRQSQAESSHSQTRYVAPTNVPRNGGASRYPYNYPTSRYAPAPAQSQTRTVSESQEDESELLQTRIPTAHSSSYGTNRQHESRSQYGTSGYQVPVRTSSSQHSDHRSESSLTNSRVVPVRIEPSEYESRRQSSSSSRQEGHTQYGGTYTPSYSSSNRNVESGHDSRSSYGQREFVRGGALPSTRFGSSVLEKDTDLNSYMSESEKLARLQAKSISSGSGTTYGSASNIDEINRRTLQQAESLDAASADFVNSQSGNQLSLDGLDASSLGTGGGFKRVKSWQKQSKWASGSEYGPDGKPKSYSMLSTAESEKHNINGAEAGFKAATTTLEDDGKVSTYSIHTP